MGQLERFSGGVSHKKPLPEAVPVLKKQIGHFARVSQSAGGRRHPENCLRSCSQSAEANELGEVRVDMQVGGLYVLPMAMW